MTERTSYQLVLRYDPTAFAGVPRDHLILALRAEGVPCSGRFYTPLVDDPLFSPDAYTNPLSRAGVSYAGQRFPVAERAASHESIWLPHELFLGGDADVDDLVEAFARIHARAAELRARPPTGPVSRRVVEESRAWQQRRTKRRRSAAARGDAASSACGARSARSRPPAAGASTCSRTWTRSTRARSGGRADRRARFKLVNLFGPDANRFVLLDREHIFSARRPWMQIMGRIFPNGLLLRDGDEHKQHRKLMHEAFTRPALREYGERMEPMIASGIGDWGGERRRFLAFPAYKGLTLDIAASIFVGVELGPADAAHERRLRGHGRGVDVAHPPAHPGPRVLPRPARAASSCSSCSAPCSRRSAPTRARDMFSRLCRARSEDGDALVDSDVLDHMIFLMMAAHDTTTSTLTSMHLRAGAHIRTGRSACARRAARSARSSRTSRRSDRLERADARR